METAFTERFGLKGPLVIAPMGAGPTTPELVAATCNAGALGSLAGAYLPPSQLETAIERTRALTDRPFVVNLFAPLPTPEISPTKVKWAIEATRSYRTELGIPAPPELKAPYHEDFVEQFATMLDAKPAAFSFAFGLVESIEIEACRSAGIYIIGQATTPDEARQLRELGVDAVVLQGTEAGGHRGMFSEHDPEPGLSIEDLLRKTADLGIPRIASGGLMTGADISRVIKLGAEAAQLGTAFLLSTEAGTSDPYRRALRQPTETRLTKAFSGRWARGLVNRFLVDMDQRSDAILPWPAQNRFTRDLRQAAVRTGRSDYLSLWAGTGVRLIQEKPAAEIVRGIFSELE